MALLTYRLLERELDHKYTCEEILGALRSMNFVEVKEEGYIPLYKREKITDALHDISGFRTDFEFITKSQMRNIEKKSKGRE